MLTLTLGVAGKGQRVQFPSQVPGGSAPAATLQGNIQPPPPSWDPYAVPGTTQPQTLMPQDYYLPGPPGYNPTPGGPMPGDPGGTFATMQRFLQEVRLDYVFISSDGERKFGVNDIEINGTFAIPFLYNRQSPLLITPGFATHFWDGPDSSTADMPPSAYSAYLGAGWEPEVTPWLSGDLEFRIGAYSDFEKIGEEAVRYTGHGLAVLSFTPSVQVKAGVVYLDRVRVKILPAVGVIWKPNPDIRFEIYFPEPKIARRLTTIGTADWWLYLRGEYGGGSWAVIRDGSGDYERVDYNDLRVALGLEWEQTGAGFDGLMEIGLSFDRELVYLGPTATYRPTPTWFVRGGLAF